MIKKNTNHEKNRTTQTLFIFNHSLIHFTNKFILMRKFILLLITVGMVGTAISQSTGPELISSSGDSFQNTTYLLDWSIGECITETNSAGTYVLTQGFHQNVYFVTNVEDLHADFEISVYPNPATDFVTIEFPSAQQQDMIMTITDQTGKVFLQKHTMNNIEQLDFSAYTCGVYLLIVEYNNQRMKSFKILKK